ncbi:ArnT family glycosyltransferase [Leptolyngbya sp. AN02str]|uniref:ArnT family glycosyltransferase n=1 Tax=Leptolyngbya sp. AN02str TaxID=3423363 RepID=UPI003D321C62
MSQDWLIFERGKWRQYTLDDWFWIAGLGMASVVMFTLRLGSLALRDWDEGTVAQVAKEISQAPFSALVWLFPTLNGQPYVNKPPLMHNLMAIAFHIGGIHEWTARLPGALLTAISVPLLYAVGREVFAKRIPALFAAMVYLTLLPVARLGRLAMLDGAVLCFALVMMWCVLRSRRDVRFALGIGIGFGLICLTKGVMLGLLLGAIALLFLLWDTPRLLAHPYLWMGLAIGSVPVLGWYGTQWWRYGSPFLGGNLVNQSFSRIWTSVENNGGPPWYYLLEIVKYTAPWLLFLPLALQRAWQNREMSWAKLAIVWGGLYLLAISLMATKLPWYVLPLYPALALMVGAQLAHWWEQGQPSSFLQKSTARYSRGWVFVLLLLAAVGGVGALYFAWWNEPAEWDLVALAIALMATFATTAILIARQNPQFLPVLGWGTYVVLMVLMVSDHWVWELAEAYPVKPVAAIVQASVPRERPVYTSFPYHRPSLNFYSDRFVHPADLASLQAHFLNEPTPYLLIQQEVMAQLQLPKPKILGASQGFMLITK